ncbi:hypothetical protein [Halarchaeum nitratireducens]|uniref:Uncharacterized protein n=1 Tax=Halarchaeum nitratireducens TaxID=489913 RepID=A0A830GCJ4_9EURY|nr:hypothetical protein [Halarchaeum nitratireducens]GGN18738.1 hypothetical protein GCM10009021_19710 [Halarchaeum nitratireducens]
MDTSLLVAIIGVGGTLAASIIGSYVNLRNTKIQEKRASYRKVAEYTLDKKINGLVEIHRCIEEMGDFGTFAYLSRTNQDITVDEEEYQSYQDSVDSFSDAVSESEIFLSENQKSILNKCLLVHRSTVSAMEETEDGYRINWAIVEDEPYIDQHDIDLDHFGVHARIASEMVYNEINAPLDEILEHSGEKTMTEEMEDYLNNHGFTTYNIERIADDFNSN